MKIKINEKTKPAEMIYALEQNGIKCFKNDTTADLRKRIEDFNNGNLKPSFIKTEYSWNAIRPAIILAHNGGNKKALNEPTCAKVKVSKDTLNQWKLTVKNLKSVVWDYVLIRRIPEASAQEVEQKRSAIFPAWKDIIKNGEASLFHNRLHLLEADIEDLIGFAWVFMATEKGTVTASETEELFRKKVESLLGCLIARQDIMSEQDAADVDAYYKTARKVKNLKNVINGKADKVGLKKEISNLQSNLGKQRAILQQLGADKDTTEALVKTLAKIVSDKQDELKEAEENLKIFEDSLPKLEKRAKEILANYEKI